CCISPTISGGSSSTKPPWPSSPGSRKSALPPSRPISPATPASTGVGGWPGAEGGSGAVANGGGSIVHTVEHRLAPLPLALRETRHHPEGKTLQEPTMATSTDRCARVDRTVHGTPASDGAGVRLTRVIGTPQLPDFDPFLMLDEFGTDRPEDYLAGFPDHPHRGFETVTYMLDGRMRHKDNHGNEGVLVPGSVQWMTAGRGLVHSEMPEQESGRMRGFQLWVNLPARDKMVEPRYQEFAPERIPQLQPSAGVTVKVVAGGIDDVRVPIAQPPTEPVHVDISVAAGTGWAYTLPEG